MKKTLVALAATAMMGAGLVGVSAETANAAPDCPYTGCVDTNTTVQSPGPVKQGQRAKICVSVRTGGNGQARGSVGIIVVRDGGGYRFTDSKRYDGRTCFVTSKLDKRGDYLVRANFEGRGAFGDSH